LPEWLVERGIGETRAALIDGGAIVEARIMVDGIVPHGTVLDARLTDVGRNGRNAIATGPNGEQYLLPRGAPGSTQGAAVKIEITRSAIPGTEPWKRSLARLAVESPPPAAASLGVRDLGFPASRDELGAAGWDDVLDQARSGMVAFAGGELRIAPTPAMTLIDVDGFLPVDELAVAGAAEAARTVLRLDIGGSIGIDLPTGGKTGRQQAAAAIDAIRPQPFERTAVNGFGFVQIVRPRRGASLIELAQDSARFEARALLRRAALDSPGAKRLVASRSVIAVLEAQPDWLEVLARQIGGSVNLRTDAKIAISGGYAEPV
jgi:ribonuclease G